MTVIASILSLLLDQNKRKKSHPEPEPNENNMSQLIKLAAILAGQDAESSLVARAKLLADSARISQESLLNQIRTRLNELKAEINQVTTNGGPETKDSLRPGDFDPSDWVETVHSLKVELREKEIELKIAQETYEEFFGTIVLQETPGD